MSEPVREQGQRKTRVGTVVSDKMEKTIVIKVERVEAHPRYSRRVKRTKRLKAHDENNECRVGDRVRVVETRPLSRDKRWRVDAIVDRAQ